MMESFLKSVSHFLNRATSTKEMRSYERLVLDAWRQTLSPAMQQVLDSQLQMVDLIQRQAGDAKVCFYYPKHGSVPSFGDIGSNANVATVVLSDTAGEKAHVMRAKLFLVNGRFFSIEFPKRPARYLQQHDMQIDKLHVVTVEAGQALPG